MRAKGLKPLAENLGAIPNHVDFAQSPPTRFSSIPHRREIKLSEVAPSYPDKRIYFRVAPSDLTTIRLGFHSAPRFLQVGD